MPTGIFYPVATNAELNLFQSILHFYCSINKATVKIYLKLNFYL